MMKSAFEKVIGYSDEKQELAKIVDMIKNREAYEAIGARMPRSVLLHGEPGVGKTLMAKCFIEECGIKTYTVRKNQSGDKFVEYIVGVFEEAAKNAPSIILLDDIDKFSDDNEYNNNSEEYVAVQTGIDDVKDSEVFVIATANEIRCLPASLRRDGRFDEIIKIGNPEEEDAQKIIMHYFSDKKVSSSVNLEDVSKMIGYSTCAELENIINIAAFNAAYRRKKEIEIEDIIESTLKKHYEIHTNDRFTDADEKKKACLHEAGHLVVCEALRDGSVGFATVKGSISGRAKGFIRMCFRNMDQREDTLISLAGKAAVELYYSDSNAEGCASDLYKASSAIMNLVDNNASYGFGGIDVLTPEDGGCSENHKLLKEIVVTAEMERYMYKARDILIRNRAFLEKTADELFEKEVLMYSDIIRIKNSVTASPAA